MLLILPVHSLGWREKGFSPVLSYNLNTRVLLCLCSVVLIVPANTVGGMKEGFSRVLLFS